MLGWARRMDRLAPTRRPAREPQGFQRWHHLLFSHWSVPEAALRPLVPARLALDTYGGQWVLDSGEEVTYSAARRRSAVQFTAHARIGVPLATAPPGSLEFFLCERYQFYAEIRGQLHRARVHHEPYDLCSVTQSHVDTTLLDAAGIPAAGARTRDLFSPGVDVDVYAVERV